MAERGGPVPGQRIGWREVPLGGYRLLITTSGGLVFIPAMVLQSPTVCTVAATIVLASALLVRDSFRPGMRGWVFVAGAHGAAVATMIGIAAWRLSWSPAAPAAGAAALLFAIQVVPTVDWGRTSDAKRLEQLRRSMAHQTTADPTARDSDPR